MTARGRFCFSRRFEDMRPKIAFSRSFFCSFCSRWSSRSFFVRFRSASWVYEARLWRTKCFLSAIPCEGPHPHVRDLRVWRDGRFFGCERSFSRGAKTSAVFLDRAGYLGEESDGVSLLFLFSQRAGGVPI